MIQLTLRRLGWPAMLFCVLCGCGESVGPGSDTSPPSQVLDLEAATTAESLITLSWTSPGDDGGMGQAAGYDIRISTDAAASWITAASLPAGFVPRPAGSRESFPVQGLDRGHTYYFALRASDEVPNWSGWSNQASTALAPVDSVPPASVHDLTATRAEGAEVLLHWTAPGDDGTLGRALRYDVRMSSTPRDADGWNTATVLPSPPLPASPGASDSMRVQGPGSGETYYFALRTVDDALNWSAWSNAATSAANLSPETIITAGPPDSTRVPHQVTFEFEGVDADGHIDHFDYLLVTHPANVDSIAPANPNYPHRVVVVVPLPDDPRWTRIDATSISLTTLADTLRQDPRGDIGDGYFDRWHSFFVRAVDNSGAVDLSPAFRSFDAFAVAPRVWLLAPVVPGSPLHLPPAIDAIFTWDGSDLIAPGGAPVLPMESRWTLFPAPLDPQGQVIGVLDALYERTPGGWSTWRDWLSPDESGTKVILRNLIPNRAYVLAVQGRDGAGAITPQFDDSTPQANNYVVFVVDGPVAAP